MNSAWVGRRLGLALACGVVWSAAGCASAMAPGSAGRTVADFEEGVASSWGWGWSASTDSIAGGTSRVELRHSPDGAAGRPGSLELSGVVGGELPYAWAGAQWSPGTAYRAPADLSDFRELRFWARGAGGAQRVMIMWQDEAGRERRHQEPFVAGGEWTEHVVSLEGIAEFEPSRTLGVLFAAGPSPGPFAFRIDRVRLLR